MIELKFPLVKQAFESLAIFHFLIIVYSLLYYKDRIKCPKQRTKTDLRLLKSPFPPWVRSYLSDILFCLGNILNIYHLPGAGRVVCKVTIFAISGDFFIGCEKKLVLRISSAPECVTFGSDS